MLRVIRNLFVFLALLGSCSAHIFSRARKWNDLKVTWGLNPFNSNYFDSLPRTAQEAVDEGFIQISGCDTNSNWRGARYVKDNNRAVTLLFDVNGYIAGIQAGIPSNLENGYPRQSLQPPFTRDGDYYIISAYFVDPSIICTTGRSRRDFQNEGTGTNLYIQNGTVAETDSVLIPRQQSDIGSTRWSEGKCFYSMGKHYWHDITLDADCNSIFPVFLLYNNGQLNGFGWAMMTYIESHRYEHPPRRSYNYFFKVIPRCLQSDIRVTTMHIYLQNRIVSNRC